MKLQKGFTLIELMLAVAIVAILAAIALPSYTAYVQRSARSNAEGDLMTAVSRLERLKAQNFSYTGATANMTSTATISSVSPTDNPTTPKYTVTLKLFDANGTSPPATTPAVAVRYEVLAVSTANFASGKSEALKINSEGQRCYKELASGVNDCSFTTDKTSWPTR